MELEELSKGEVRGRRSIHGETKKKNMRHRFDDEQEQMRKQAGGRRHKFFEEADETEEFDEEDPYADLIDIRRIR